MASVTVNSLGYRPIDLRSAVPYYARIIRLTTEMFIDDNYFDQKLQNPTKYFRAGQLTCFYEGYVVLHKMLNFEKEDHGLFVPNLDVNMPITIYPEWHSLLELGDPPAGVQQEPTGKNLSQHTRLPKTIPDPFATIEVNAGVDLVCCFHRKVMDTKPGLFGWLPYMDSAIVESFHEGVSITLDVTAIR